MNTKIISIFLKIENGKNPFQLVQKKISKHLSLVSSKTVRLSRFSTLAACELILLISAMKKAIEMKNLLSIFISILIEPVVLCWKQGFRGCTKLIEQFVFVTPCGYSMGKMWFLIIFFTLCTGSKI